METENLELPGWDETMYSFTPRDEIENETRYPCKRCQGHGYFVDVNCEADIEPDELETYNENERETYKGYYDVGIGSWDLGEFVTHSGCELKYRVPLTRAQADEQGAHAESNWGIAFPDVCGVCDGKRTVDWIQHARGL